MILLIDERPEEADMQRSVKAGNGITFDEPPENHVKLQIWFWKEPSD